MVPLLTIAVWNGALPCELSSMRMPRPTPEMVAPAWLVIEPPPAAMPSLVLGRPSDP